MILRIFRIDSPDLYPDLSGFEGFRIDLPDFKRFTDAGRSKPLCVAYKLIRKHPSGLNVG